MKKSVLSALTAALVASALSSAGAANVPVKLQLKWFPQAQFAGFFVAQAKGFYKAEGLDVTLLPIGDQSPIQTVATGAADELTSPELAVVCASHSGEERHVGAVRSVLDRAGLDESFLQCGAHLPMYGPAAREVYRSGEEPTAVHHNCSGKHAGMLLACARNGWETENYRDPGHPLQRLNLSAVARCCGVGEEDVRLATDGCGVPVFALPLGALAAGFARLAGGENLPDDLAAAAARVRTAIRAHPFMVAGTGRLDTGIMQSTNLISKGGAEGVLAVGSPEGWGVAIKISDGSGRPLGLVARAALAERGVDLQPEGMLRTELRNPRGDTVGEMEVLLRPEVT